MSQPQAHGRPPNNKRNATTFELPSKEVHLAKRRMCASLPHSQSGVRASRIPVAILSSRNIRLRERASRLARALFEFNVRLLPSTGEHRNVQRVGIVAVRLA